MPRRKATNNEAGEDVELSAPKRKMQRVNVQLSVPERPSVVGHMLVCGTGETGQLGLGVDISERKRPAIIEKIKNVVDICAGGMHNLVLTSEGTVYSFGCNDEGALGRETADDDEAFEPQKVELPLKVVMISAGDSHSACLLEDGRVFAWGSFRDSHGNMGLTLDGNQKFPVEVMNNVICTEIASGSDHLVVLTSNGKVFTFGCAEQGQLGRVSSRSASGEGRRGKSQLLIPGEVNLKSGKRVEKIWATTYCTFLRESNTNIIWAFGLNNYAQLTYNKNGINTVTNPVKINLENVKDITGGAHHTLVLKNDNKCYAIGRRDYGRLGLGALQEDIRDLHLVNALKDKNILSVSCGESISFAVTDDGKLYSWGMGTNLQLGTGNDEDALEPVLIISKNTENRKIIKAAGGGQHSIFLVTDNNNADKNQKATINKKVETASAKETNSSKPTNSTEVSAAKSTKGRGKNPGATTNDISDNKTEKQAEEKKEAEPAAKRARKKK